VNSSRRFPPWVRSLPVFLDLKKLNTVLVLGNEIDREGEWDQPNTANRTVLLGISFLTL